MMKYSRLIFIAAMLAALLIVFPASVHADAVDTTPPELMGVNILTPSVKAGETAYVQILVKEEGRGLTDVGMTLYDTENKQYFTTQYHSWLEEDASTPNPPGPQISYGTDYITYTFEFHISENCMKKGAMVYSVELHDMRSNSAVYYNIDGDLVNSQTSSRVNNVGTFSIYGGQEDPIEPHDPVNCKLKSISYKSKEIAKPGKIKNVIVFDTDGTLKDVYVSIQYSRIKDNYTLTMNTDELLELKKINNTTYETSSELKRTVNNGEWVISEIDISYNYYYNNKFIDTTGMSYMLSDDRNWLVNSKDPDDKLEAERFIISGEEEDEVAPVVNSITLLSDEPVMAPGLLPIEIDITEEGSGVTAIYIIYMDRTNKYGGSGEYSTIYTDYQDYESQLITEPLKTGKYRFYLPVYSNTLPGEYMIQSIQLVDAFDNISIKSYNWESEHTSFSVTSEFDVDFETIITSPGLAQMVRDMPEGKAAKIFRVDRKNYIKKEVLDEIAGKDKTLIIDLGELQWVMSGKDMPPDSTKDLDLNVSVTNIPAYELGTDNDAVGLIFGKNGKLPGGIQVRFPSIFFNYFLGQVNKLHLYYVKEKVNANDQTIDLDGASISEENDTKIKLVSDNSGVWCYIDIPHNSSFIVSGDKLKKTINHFEKNASFAPLFLKSTKQTKSSIKLQWKKVKRARTYAVYGCTSSSKSKLVKLATTRRTSVNIKKISKNLKKKTYYKFIVVAADEDNRLITASSPIHVSTKGSLKSGNPKKLVVKAKKNGKWRTIKSMSLKKKKSAALKVRQVMPKKTTMKKKVSIRYESSNKKVAVVSSKGVIKGIKKGRAKIYVYAQNGVYKTITVTVK